MNILPDESHQITELGDLTARDEYKQRFEAEDTSELYDKYRPKYTNDVFDVIYDFCSQTAKGNQERVALDVACGTGLSTIPLADVFDLVIGVDVSKSQLAKARAAASHVPNIKYLEGSAEDLPINSGSISLITVAVGLHWLNQEKFYQEADRVLVPGGVIAVYQYTTTPQFLNHAKSDELTQLAGEILKLFARETEDGNDLNGLPVPTSLYDTNLKHPKMQIPYANFQRCEDIPFIVKTTAQDYAGFLASIVYALGCLIRGSEQTWSHFKCLQAKFMEVAGGPDLL